MRKLFSSCNISISATVKNIDVKTLLAPPHTPRARSVRSVEAFNCAIYTTEKLSLVFSSVHWATTVRFEPVTLVSEVTAYTAGALKARIQFLTRMFNCFRLATNWPHANLHQIEIFLCTILDFKPFKMKFVQKIIWKLALSIYIFWAEKIDNWNSA